MHLSDFDFDLPSELIAQAPVFPRDTSRLIFGTKDRKIEHGIFSDIKKVFKKGDVLVLNDTKVIPALLHARKQNCEGNSITINLVKKIQNSDLLWQILAKPAKKLALGDILYFDEDGEFKAEVVYKESANNEIYIKFLMVSEAQIFHNLERYGMMPLPQYIKRNILSSKTTDNEAYQTEYARELGSFAAPTAGLHFTTKLLQEIRDIGVEIVFVTLHVGLGTFLPIKTDDINTHRMHTESFSISDDTASTINMAKKRGAKVICVGTTTLRALESSADAIGMVMPTHSSETDIFIKPGYEFRVVDSLVTNFHLPKSTLFVLVSAFTSLEFMGILYSEAISNSYRFFSYGDACYIERFCS